MIKRECINMKKLNIKDFTSAFEYEQAKKQVKNKRKQRNNERNLKRSSYLD